MAHIDWVDLRDEHFFIKIKWKRRIMHAGLTKLFYFLT